MSSSNWPDQPSRRQTRLSALQDPTLKRLITAGVVVAGCVGLAAVAKNRIYITRANEYLVRSGLGIKDIQVGKTFVRWPLQVIERLDMTPSTIKLKIPAKTQEKLAIEWPVVLTYGPADNIEALNKYAKFIMNLPPMERLKVITGLLEGNARAVAANTSIEDLFADREVCRNQVAVTINSRIEEFGMRVHNLSAEDINDHSGYFSSLEQPITAGAKAKAKVEVAEREKEGNIGAALRTAETRQRVAVIEASTVKTENERRKEIVVSTTELNKLQAEQKFIVDQAKITAENNARIYEAEKTRELEVKRRMVREETLRADDLAKSIVQAEMEVRAAEGRAQAVRIKAEAELYAKQMEADGIRATFEAEAAGRERLLQSFQGNVQDLMMYELVNRDMYEKLAKANADAIQGLSPKITIWANDGQSAMSPIADLMKTLPPMVDTIQNQTGYKILPDFVIKKADNCKEGSSSSSSSTSESTEAMATLAAAQLLKK